MVEEKFCQDCRQRQGCREVYEQLGKSEGASVVSKVVLAFLVPLVVFVGLLAVCEQMLASWIEGKGLRTGVSFLLAVLGTLGVILILRVINRRLGRNG